VRVPNTTPVPKFKITVFNGNATGSRPLGAYMYARFRWAWKVPTTATIKVQYDHPLAQRLLQCKRSVVPIRTYRNGIPWDGRVMEAVVEGPPGEEIVTVTCMSNLYWLICFLAWVNPLLPPEVQIGLTGKQDMMFGSVDFVLKYFLAKNATRMQKPVYAALPLQYDSPDLPQIGDIGSLDDLLDIILGYTKDLAAVAARFTMLDELYRNPIANSGRGMSIHMWTPDDGPSPTVFNTDTLARLQNVLDLSGDNFFYFTNPDNILELANPATWNSMSRPGYVFDTHVQRDRTHIMWRTDAGQILNIYRRVTHPTAHSVIVGGKAPDFVNQTIEWAANMVLELILNALLPGLNLGTILVGDLFDDIFFAFQKFDDPQLEADLGEHGFGEAFVDNTGAWSLDAFSVGMEGLKKHGGSEGLKLTVQSGGPDGYGLSFGEDDGTNRRFNVGDIMTFVDRGTYVQDYVSAVEVEDSLEEYMTEYVTIGDDEIMQDGWTQLVGHLKSGAALSRAVAVSTA